MINVDFADVRTVMSEMGQAMIGFGSAHGAPGEGRAEEAARIAVRNDLLEKVDLTNAKGILINITGGFDIAFDEFNVVGDTIHSFASEDATIVVGTTLIPEMSDEIRVTIVATGLGEITPNETIQVQKTAQQLSPLHQPVDGNSQAIPLRTQEQQPITTFRQPEPIRSPERNLQQTDYRSGLERPITERLSSFKKFDPSEIDQNDK